MHNRNTSIYIDPTALLHNLVKIKRQAPHAKVVAMVKANAYGCGIKQVIPTLEGKVDLFGVITTGEAMAIRKLGAKTPCLVIQGAFEPSDWDIAAQHNFIYAIHCTQQLNWLLNTPLKQAVTVWIKLNTGMNRLGLQLHEANDVIQAVAHCPWVKKPSVLMTHFANADLPAHPLNHQQVTAFNQLALAYPHLQQSLANSAAIFTLPHTHADYIRPGISLYGISPFEDKTGMELGFQPVMHFTSKFMHTYAISAGTSVGYGSTWTAKRPSRLGVIPVGYGDGYPRVVQSNTPVWIQGQTAPIIGRISMDTMVVDLTDLPEVATNDPVELWGTHLPIERIAKAANTIPYELLCKVLIRP
jgi:alanine racemase